MKLRKSLRIIPLLSLLSLFFNCDVLAKNVYAISSKDSPVVVEQVNDISIDNGIKEEKDYESSDEKTIYNLSDNCINFARENSVEDLKVVNSSSDSLTISWTYTSEQTVHYYSIEWYENEEFIASANETSSPFTLTIENLEACTTYKIRVTPNTLENKSTRYKEINATTCKISSSECSNVEANPLKLENSLFLNISWEAPVIGRNCIKKYKILLEALIYGRNHSVTTETNRTNLLVGQLYACTSYTVRIHAVDVDGLPGACSSEMIAPPTQAKVRIPPRLLNKIHVPPLTTTSTTITLNWNVIDEKNNCSISRVKSRCSYTYSLGSGYKLKESEKIVTVVEENPRNVSVVVDDLTPYTRYHCWGQIGNGAGYSFRSSLIPGVVTKEAVPSAPEDFEVANNVDFKFTWNPPQLIPGRMIKYRMTFFWEPLYPMPTACQVFRGAVVDNIESHLRSFTWNGGEGYSRYSVYIEAQTGAGWGTRSANISFDSNLKGVSDEVTNLRYTLEPRESNDKVLEAKLRWNLTCSLKGILNSFDIRVHGFKDDLENHTRHFLMEVPTNITNNEEFGVNLGELKPEYHYKFEIAAVIHGASSKGAVSRYWATFSAGIPPEPKKAYMQTITLHPDKMSRTICSFEILLPLFADSSGDVRYYALIVSRQDFQYEAAERRFNLRANYILNYGSIKAVKFVVGNDITCKDVSLVTKNKLYCNGPLNPSTRYEVRMRAFTSGGYSDSPPIFVETKAEISAILLASIVLRLLVLGMILSMIIAGKIYFKRKEKNLKSVAEDTDQGSQSRRMTLNALPRYSQDTSSRVRRH